MFNLSGVDKVYNALVVSKEKLTAKQIAARYNLANPYDAVYTLRQEGYVINIDQFVDTKGRVKNKYSFGKPSRELIAAGYKAIAAGLV